MTALPFDGAYPEEGGEEFTDGWSGSPASHERALDDSRSGRAQQRRYETIRALSIHGAAGLTWKELADTMGWHHGQASGVLSVLHKEERIACLMDKRHKCHVYVLPDCVEDRATRPHGSTAAHMREQRLVDTHDQQVAAARAEGFAEGWQDGYDDASKGHELLVQQAGAAYDRGVAVGRVKEAQRQLAFITELRRILKQTKGTRSITHNHTCWAEYPSCTLDSVEKNVMLSIPPKGPPGGHL